MIASQNVRIHVSYAHNNADAQDIVMIVNGSEYVSNESGWIDLFSTIDTIGKSSWHINSITNVDGYNILIEEPSIIWDEVEARAPAPLSEYENPPFNTRYILR